MQTTLDRALGPRGVSERRRLADRVAVRQRSEIPHRRLHDEHALQARAGRFEVEAGAVPCRSEGEDICAHSSVHALASGTRRRHRRVAALRAGAARRRPPPMVELIGSWTMVERRGAPDSHRSRAGARQLHRLSAERRRQAEGADVELDDPGDSRASVARRTPASYSMRGPNPSPHIGEIIDPGQPPADRVHADGPLREREPHDLARRPAASVGLGRASVDRLLDRRVGKRDAARDDHALQADVHPAERRSGQPVRRDARVLHPARRPDDAHLADRRPGLPRRADGAHVDVPVESRGARERHRRRWTWPRKFRGFGRATCRTIRWARRIPSTPTTTSCRSKRRSAGRRRSIRNTPRS